MIGTIWLAMGLSVGIGSARVEAEPPSDQQILGAQLSPAPRGIPFVYESYRDDIVIVKNRLAAKPFVGAVEILGVKVPLIEMHWECSVYFTETIQSEFPFPIQLRKKRVDTVYIDTLQVAK